MTKVAELCSKSRLPHPRQLVPAQVLHGPVRAGEGYIVAKDTSPLPELDTTPDVTVNSYTIPLQPGWNMIGNPYNGNVLLRNVQVQQNTELPVS